MAYSSKYYDPVKAHEYYMAHRQLKGRQSTKGLSKKGKSDARYIKEQIMAEKKEYLEKQKSVMNGQISALRDKLKNMSKEQRKACKDQIYSQIKELRELYKTHKEAVKEYYNEKYYGELDKLKASR